MKRKEVNSVYWAKWNETRSLFVVSYKWAPEWALLCSLCLASARHCRLGCIIIGSALWWSSPKKRIPCLAPGHRLSLLIECRQWCIGRQGCSPPPRVEGEFVKERFFIWRPSDTWLVFFVTLAYWYFRLGFLFWPTHLHIVERQVYL